VVENLTAADDSYTHQIVAPAARTAYTDPAWAERCWHVVDLGDGWMAGAGRAVWAHGGRRTARAGVSTPTLQLSRRVEEPFDQDDDPNRGDVGPIRIDTVEPLREIRLVLEEPGLDFGFDLTYRARSAGVPTERNLIEREGVVLTDYMNFFQSGLYSGVVYANGEERRIEDRAGFRDRGWGLRRHEGPARRGLHIACMSEFDDHALYILLYETGSGRRAFTNGWLLDGDGVVDVVTEVEHELEFDGQEMTAGTIGVGLASGASRELQASVTGRLWISTLGYTLDPELEGPGTNRFDLLDEGVRTRIAGVCEQACRFESGAGVAHGFVETGLGVHPR
jgi:hypothetical protein